MVLTLHMEHLPLWRTAAQDHIVVWGWLTIPSSSSSWSPSTIIIIFMNSHALSHCGLGTVIIIALWDDWEKYYQFQEPYLHDHLKVQELDKHWSKSQQFVVNCGLIEKMILLQICLKMKERPHQNVTAMISFFCQEWKRWLAIRAHFKFSSWTWDWWRWWWWSLGIRTTYFCHTSFFEREFIFAPDFTSSGFAPNFLCFSIFVLKMKKKKLPNLP